MKHFSNSNLLEQQTEDESKSDQLHQENCFKGPIEIKSAFHHKIRQFFIVRTNFILEK